MSLSHVPLQSIQRFWDIPMTMETLMYTLSLQKNNLGMVKTKKSPPQKKMVFSHPIAARPSANAAQMAPSSSQSLAELGWLSPPCHPPPGARRAAVFLLEEAAPNQG
jgi:hypothetical protein